MIDRLALALNKPGRAAPGPRRWWRRLRYGAGCSVCGVPSWLNSPRWHADWVGHRWRRGTEYERANRSGWSQA